MTVVLYSVGATEAAQVARLISCIESYCSLSHSPHSQQFKAPTEPPQQSQYFCNFVKRKQLFLHLLPLSPAKARN